MRQWQMLWLIPRQPSKMPTTASMQRLADDGVYSNTNELFRWLLGFGENIEVLEPLELRDEFKRISHAMAASYSDDEA